MQEHPHDPDEDRDGLSALDTAIEDLLVAALTELEAHGEAALEQFLNEHPAQAPQLRAALMTLQSIDLLEQPSKQQMPQRFGDFVVKRQLGAGGMGVVFLAEQASLGREVAVKVVRPELLLFEGARERFQREIDAVARLDHPAIVPILATGAVEDVPYYVMPRLRGASGEDVVDILADRVPNSLAGADLRQVLAAAEGAGDADDDGTFDGDYWQAVVRLVRKAALGIQHAHARGILHRDLKPSNLMLTPTGAAVVLDFGLAQATDDARLTRTGATAGSPAYMSPEQLNGEPADVRSDVYGLGATLHCLLGLRPPFPTENGELMRRRILAGESLELRARAALPTELLLVVGCAMDVDRQHRYASAQTFADDLLAALEGRPILARRLPTPVRLRRWVQRHRAIASAIAVALIFIALLPTVLLWQQSRASAELAQEVEKTSTANTALQLANAALAQQVQRSDHSVEVSIEAVERLLANVAKDKLRNLPAALEMGASVMQDALALFDDLSGDDRFRERISYARLKALLSLLELQDTLGQMTAAEQTGEEILLRMAELFPGDEPVPAPVQVLRAQTHRVIAGLLIKRGRIEGIQEHADAARSDYEAAVVDPPLADPSLRALIDEELGMLDTVDASLAMQRRDAKQAEAALRRAVAHSAAAHSAGRSSRSHQVTRLNLAKFLRQLRRPLESLELTDAVLAELDPLPTAEVGWPVPRMVLAMAHAERFRALEFAGRMAESRAAFAPAIAAIDAVVRDYPDAADARRLRAATNGNLARTLIDGEPELAESLLLSAIADLRQLLQQHANDADAHRFLIQQLKTYAFLLRAAGRWQDLAPVARQLGAMSGAGTHRETAARDLLRCARQANATNNAVLRDEAMQLLLASHRSGAKVLVDDELYAPLREDPRFAELRRQQ